MQGSSRGTQPPGDRPLHQAARQAATPKPGYDHLNRM